MGGARWGEGLQEVDGQVLPPIGVRGADQVQGWPEGKRGGVLAGGQHLLGWESLIRGRSAGGRGHEVGWPAPPTDLPVHWPHGHHSDWSFWSL